VGGLFKSPPKPPSVPKPAPAPIVSPETGDEAIRQARKNKGFASTMLTGSLTPMSTGKKTTLG
jgi:hypothetical protein